MREAARLRPAAGGWAFALRAGLAVALPLVVLLALGRSGWAAVATFGAFAILYARDAHYRSRPWSSRAQASAWSPRSWSARSPP